MHDRACRFKRLFHHFFSSALIILAGAGYALLFAWSKVHANALIKGSAYVCCLILLAAVAELSRATNFSGYWLTVSLAMVIGYFFAPIGIWYLYVKTYKGHDTTTTTLEEEK